MCQKCNSRDLHKCTKTAKIWAKDGGTREGELALSDEGEKHKQKGTLRCSAPSEVKTI